MEIYQSHKCEQHRRNPTWASHAKFFTGVRDIPDSGVRNNQVSFYFLLEMFHKNELYRKYVSQSDRGQLFSKEVLQHTLLITFWFGLSNMSIKKRWHYFPALALSMQQVTKLAKIRRMGIRCFSFTASEEAEKQKRSSGKEEWWHHLSTIFALKLESAFWSIVAQKGSNILQLSNT